MLLMAALSACMAGAVVTSAGEEAAEQAVVISAKQMAADVLATESGLGYQIPSSAVARLLMIRRDKPGEVEVHTQQNDVIVVESGQATITMGGTVTGNREIQPTEWRGGVATGGTSYRVARGDLILIPAGIPHQVLVSKGQTVTYLAIKTARQK
jgi:mannose-6-phosphate isomerase-like protein (cupin superfamily)